MSTMPRQKSNLYDTLAPLLDKGADDAILAAARKQYRRTYKAAWQRTFRKNNKLFTVAYTGKELAIIKTAAKTHHRSMSKFIAQAALAYCTQQYLVMDTESVNHIKELLVMTYTIVQQLCEEADILRTDTKVLLTTIATLETNIMASLRQPRSLQEWVSELITRNPENKQVIDQLLKCYE
jgi:hypothetical protein